MDFGSTGRCSTRRFPKPASRPVKVMVIDDYPDSAVVVSLYLSMQGFEARYVTAPDAAQGEASRYCPDIVLVDINMPGMDGFDVASAIRATNVTREAVLIAHTSDEWRSIEARALAVGFDGYFRKATSPQELAPFLSAYIADRTH
ncbi:response regulator [Burkholderia gladioli]|uniref:response regulator n=1 Tax=Burkholderia gladioli TaxID=28095 RepID=UPI001641486C|nr:response regulator [Burkholderia gladioli]MBU9421760.1 response regulator [Burkholderia gladioli]MDN8062769.1 response regulator [Burkholderia gladioli]